MELHELGRKPTFTVSTWTWAQSLKITDNHYKTHTLSLSHTLTLSLSHTHTHTHSLSLSHTLNTHSFREITATFLPDECQIRVWLSFAFLQSKFYPVTSLRNRKVLESLSQIQSNAEHLRVTQRPERNLPLRIQPANKWRVYLQKNRKRPFL